VDKPHIIVIYLSHRFPQKLVLGSFDNINFTFVFLRTQTLQ